MTRYQCAVCELVFSFPSELDEHMAVDHPEFHWEPKSVEDALLAASHPRKHLAPKYPPEYKADPPPE